MNDFVASSVCWTIETSWRTSPRAQLRVLRQESIDDLGLEDDVRQALGRPVVHRPGDIAAEILLGRQDDPRHALGRRGLGRGRGRIRARRKLADLGTRSRRRRRERSTSSASESRKRASDLALAVEDLDLRLHDGRAAGERDELDVEGEEVLGGAIPASRPACRWPGPASARAARPRSGPAARACRSRSISPSSVATSRTTRATTSPRESGAALALLRGHGRRDQSSGIRIQPWRIAYTTAWVRSLTDSLRRIELMWFLTVCSLIERA